MDISIIITAHDEGLLAHKTLLSVSEAINKLKKSIKTEIIIHIDKGTPDTIKYFKSHKGNFDLTIYENNFGDLGLSRNFAIKRASGKYVFLMDADDLISENLFAKAYEQIEKSKNDILLHPNYVLSFGEYYELEVCSDGVDKEHCAAFLCSKNQWPSTVFGKRETFLSNKYIETKDGIGHEDYCFNIHTASKGIMHHVIPGSILFYRRKSSSLSISSNAKNVIQPKSELFNKENILHNKYLKDYHQKSSTNLKSRIKVKLRSAYVYVRETKFGDIVLTPLAKAVKYTFNINTKDIHDNARRYVDSDFLRLWKQISKIETQIYPFKERIDSMPIYIPNSIPSVSLAYEELISNYTNSPDYIFIVPWIRVGGADKVLLNYIKALQSRQDAKIAVISTVPGDNDCSKNLPSNVDYYDFGNASLKLDAFDKSHLFSRLLVQLDAKRIHIINSAYGYDWIKKHIDYAIKNLKVSISLFSRDYISDTNMEAFYDYADPYAVAISRVLSGIYTDNARIIKRLHEQNAFDKSLIKVHYQPVEKPTIVDPSKQKEFDDHKKHILWASRVCREKNPELLAKISGLLDGAGIHIDAYGEIQDPKYSKQFFSKLKNVTYHGAYDSISHIPVECFDGFLYTSISDGLPNILLEIAARGLPIIASAVGGVPDLINDKTGFLITNAENPESYVDAIKFICNNDEIAEEKAKEAKKVIEKRHSWDAFIDSVNESFKKGDPR
jgi:glycosyltransferase involved in cell wall biosynthesis